MAKIIEYKIAHTGSFGEGGTVDASVNEFITEGWQPFGSPMVTPEGIVGQAMVKYEEESVSGKTLEGFDE